MIATLLACTLVALLAASDTAPATGHSSLATPRDSIARAAILDEMRAFYRDLDDRNWNAMLSHFIPAKVTARWTPPADSSEWARLDVPPPAAADGPASVAGRCELRASVAIVGDWARVRARRCAAPPDEAWLLRVSGRWKIVHLILAPPGCRFSEPPAPTLGGAVHEARDRCGGESRARTWRRAPARRTP